MTLNQLTFSMTLELQLINVTIFQFQDNPGSAAGAAPEPQAPEDLRSPLPLQLLHHLALGALPEAE